jgi:xanthine/uracil permease
VDVQMIDSQYRAYLEKGMAEAKMFPPSIKGMIQLVVGLAITKTMMDMICSESFTFYDMEFREMKKDAFKLNWEWMFL